MRKPLPNIAFRDCHPYFRRRIPTSVQHQFDGQKEIFIRLPIAKKQDIKHFSTLLNAKFETAIHLARMGCHRGRFGQQQLIEVMNEDLSPTDSRNEETPSNTPKQLLASDINLLAQRYLALQLTMDEGLRYGTADQPLPPRTLPEHREYKSLLEDTVQTLEEAQAIGDSSIIQDTVTSFLESEGFVINVADALFRELEKKFLSTDVEVARLQLRRAQGETINTPPVEEIDDENLKFSSLVEPWVTGRDVKQKSAIEGRAAVKLFLTWATLHKGRDIAVNRVSVEDAADFRDWLLKYVPNRYKNSNKTLSPSSVKKYLGLLGGMVSHYCTDRTVDFSNVFVAVKKPKAPKSRGKTRLPFTAEQLNQMISHKAFKSLRLSTDPFEITMYWIFAIGLYTGARLEEIGQLSVRDISSFNGQALIHFCENSDWQHIKTSDQGDAGQRYVPVHSELIRLGILEFHEKQKAASGRYGRLFDTLKPDSHGVLTGYLSKRYAKLLDDVGLPDPRLTYHSLRHTFKHYGRLCGIPKAELDQLVGHESGEVGDSYGGENYPIEPLIEAMTKFKLPVKL